MREQDYAVNNSVQAEQLEVSRVLRNTYGLLALTLAFSGVMAFVAQQMRVGYPNIFVVLIGFYGLFFLTNKLRDSVWGLVSTFALTGFMGFLLGPILNRYLGMQGGAEVVASAFAMTALVFGGLSAYVLITRKDMSFLGGLSLPVSLFCWAQRWQASSFRLAACSWLSAPGLFCSLRSAFCSRPAPSLMAASVTTSWRPLACMFRSTTCSSACCKFSAS